MRRFLIAALAVAAAWAVVGLMTSLAAAAPADCAVVSRTTGECRIQVDVPGSSGDSVISNRSQGGNGDSASGRGNNDACLDTFASPPREIPCSEGILGYWSNDRQCYVALVDPQPPKTSPLWGGNTEGAIYSCNLGVVLGGGTGGGSFWSATPPAGPAAPPDPAVLAQQAIATMDLQAIQIGIVPEPGPDSIGLVGLPVWMWVDQPGENTYGPISRNASAGGTTVTATAAVERIVWNMGDGEIVTCTSPGTPYADFYGDADSPDCGHRYTRTSSNQPDSAYAVTASSYWVVDWEGGGQTGTIELDFSQTTQVRIGELQVIQTN